MRLFTGDARARIFLRAKSEGRRNKRFDRAAINNINYCLYSRGESAQINSLPALLVVGHLVNFSGEEKEQTTSRAKAFVDWLLFFGDKRWWRWWWFRGDFTVLKLYRVGSKI